MKQAYQKFLVNAQKINANTNTSNQTHVTSLTDCRYNQLFDHTIDGRLIHRLTEKNCNILFYGGFMLGWV